MSKTGPWPPKVDERNDAIERHVAAERHRRIYDATRHASCVKDIPDQAHFAVLLDESMTYDDGYGERGSPSMSTHQYLSYVYFTSDEALEQWIIENNGKKTFKVLNIRPVTYELKTIINMEKD